MLNVFDKEEVNRSGPAMAQNQVGTRIAGMASILNGDIVFDLTAGQTLEPTAAVWTKTFTITAKNAAGDVLPISGIALAVSIADTSTAGTAAVDDTTPTLVNGTVDIVVSGDAAAWLDTETATATLANLTYLGYTVTGGAMVVTITA